MSTAHMYETQWWQTSSSGVLMKWLCRFLLFVCYIFSRAKLHTKKAPLMKSKHLTSTTTYSFKSMSYCSMCGSVMCSNEWSLSTVKSMSLCKSCLDDVNSGDFCVADVPTSASQVLQPLNSTLVEEDSTIQLRDIIPQDLSAIMGE